MGFEGNKEGSMKRSFECLILMKSIIIVRFDQAQAKCQGTDLRMMVCTAPEDTQHVVNEYFKHK